jgi:hypothetical protein
MKYESKRKLLKVRFMFVVLVEVTSMAVRMVVLLTNQVERQKFVVKKTLLNKNHRNVR